MNRIVAWFATNHVAANLLMGFAILAGLASLTQIPVKLYPDVDLPIITVTVEYLGAAPEEVESGVCTRIEEHLEGLDGIKELRARASEGVCTVEVELFFEADRQRVLGEVENRVNAIDTFPDETERPVVELAAMTDLVLEIAVTGPTDERALKELGRRVRDDIRSLPGVTHTTIANERPYEISVEVAETSLSRNNLTFDDIAKALRRRSVDIPGGAMRTDEGEILLRTSGQAYLGRELENLLITTRADGTRVLLKDVASVVDGFADTFQGLRFDGKPAALIRVARVGNQDVGEISETVERFLEDAPSRYPDGVEVSIWKDESTRLSVRLGALLDSGVQGLLLILILLALFLRPHLALWVAVGIAIAFLGAIFFIFLFGYSMDATSVMGFILALGLLVDDAVVVGESVYVSHRRGMGQLAGAIEGTQRVLVPVMFGVLTTVVAFVPLLFAVSAVGVMLGVIAGTVICCVAFSLIECLLVLPAHLGHRIARMPLGEFGMTLLVVVVIAAFVVVPDARSGAALAVVAAAVVWASHLAGFLSGLGSRFTRAQVQFELGLEWLIEKVFRRLARAAFRNRALTLAFGFAALVTAPAIIYSDHVPYSFIIPTKGDSIVARLTMPLGSSEAATAEVVARLGDSAREVERRLVAEHEDPVVAHIMEFIGTHPSPGGRLGFALEPSGGHLGGVTMQLTPGETRDITTDAVAALWRTANGRLASDIKLAFITDRIAWDPDIDIQVSGDDTESLGAVVATIRRELSGYPGVHQINDSVQTGKEELKLKVTPAGQALGISLEDLGRQVRQAFYGEEVQRVQRGPDDIRIMVRYRESARRSLDSLYALRVRTPAGAEVPFQTVADVRLGRGLADIERRDGARTVSVTAAVDPEISTAEAVLGQLDSGFLERTVAAYPGVTYSLASAEEQTEMGAAVGPLFVVALLVIYALLAIPLKSYTQPLIIMSVLPFAFVGAVWGHALLKPFDVVIGFSLTSIFGVVAACGVVVNATLVLIHGVNRFRASGDSMLDALVNAAVSRFRPILITTVTTMSGLTPLMLTESVQAKSMVPMAISLGFGVLVSSAAALLLVPAFWLLLHDISQRGKRVADRVGGLMGSAPRLLTWMARYPYIKESLRTQEFTDLELDDLDLDPETARIARQGLVRLYYEREFDAEEMHQQFGLVAAKVPNADDLVDEARRWAEQRTFQLGVHMADGAIAPRDAAGPLSDILTTCLDALLTATEREFVAEHGEIPNHRLALVAHAALGRREFATGGRLDLAMLYDHGPTSSVGMLAPDEWYEQLLQRLLVLIGKVSPEGILYDGVNRYAFHGVDGVRHAMSLEGFAEHFNAAPLRDLRMLTHARVIGAGRSLAADFEVARRSVLSRQHDLAAVAADIATVRQRDPSANEAEAIWDVSRLRGGLDELELAAEFLQLAGAAPDSGVNGLATTFETAGRRELLDSRAAEDLAHAAGLWQNLVGFFRMTCFGRFNPASTTPEQREVIAQIAGVDDFGALPSTIADTARRAAEHLDALIGRVARV